MLEILASVTTVIAFVSTSWGFYQKFKERKARKEVLEIQREGRQQREQLIQEGRMERQRLLDEIQEIGERHDRDLASTQEQFEKIIAVNADDLAILRGQVGKLMDMIMSGEEIKVEPNGETVSIQGASGEVTMRTATLNKVVEQTSQCRYEKSGHMFAKTLKRVKLDPVPEPEAAFSVPATVIGGDPLDKG